MEEAIRKATIECDVAVAELERMLDEARAYHLRRGPSGSDPRLYWYLPAYKFSLKFPSAFSALLRRAEGLFIRLSPTFLRVYQKLSGVPRSVISPYGLALYIQAYSKIYARSGRSSDLRVIVDYCKLLIDSLIRTGSGNLGVGNPLEPSSEVNLPAGSEAVFALMDAYRITGSSEYLDCARKITDSFVSDFQWKASPSGGVALDYTVGCDNRYVLNANALAAAALSRVAAQTGTDEYKEVIVGILKYLKTYFMSRDSLPYAGVEDERSGKAYDVYHTGFSIRGVTEACDHMEGELASEWRSLLKSKAESMRRDFLTEDGLIQVKAQRPLIVDIHGVAEYIRCLSEVDFRLQDVPVFLGNLRYMYRKGGFYYQRGLFSSFVYMPRWGHAPTMLAIATLIEQLESHARKAAGGNLSSNA